MYYSIWLWHTYPSIHSQWIAIYIKLLVRIALTHYLLDGSQYFCWQLFSSAIDGATRIPLHRHAYTIHSTANGTVSETNYSGASALTLILSLSFYLRSIGLPWLLAALVARIQIRQSVRPKEATTEEAPFLKTNNAHNAWMERQYIRTLQFHLN